MIDEKKLIEDIRTILDGKLAQLSLFVLSRRKIEQFIETKEDIISVIEQQPKTDWIPCEERMPSEDESWVDKDATGYREPMYFIVQVKGAELPSVAYCIDGTFEPCDYDTRFSDDVIA